MNTYPSAGRQKGAATLIVVMVLFFIISLVAAYTSRNMIFEQRTSANQYRSTQALEAAEAGLEWALTMLNFGRIDGDCVAITNPAAAGNSFRQRYLEINAGTGKILALKTPGGADLTPQCVFDPATSAWNCSCPVDGAPVLGAPAGAAFRVRFVRIEPASAAQPTQPGVVRVQVVGCTRLDNVCLSFSGQGQTNEGRVFISSLVALTGNVASRPLAALTARGAVTLGGGTLSVYNGAAGSLGLTIQSGGAIGLLPPGPDPGPGFVLRTTAGTPTSTSLIDNDPDMILPPAGPYLGPDRMFATVFSMFPESFRQQQGGLQKRCGVGGCSSGIAGNAGDVRNLIALNPGRPLWLDGNLTIDTAGDIGSAAEPVLLIVNGNVAFAAGFSSVKIHGLVYVRPDWVTSGSGQFSGAVVSEGSVSVGAGDLSIVHSADTLNILRGNTGTFVRVPSSWVDYQ